VAVVAPPHGRAAHQVPARVTAREVLGVPEFRALLGSSALSILGDEIARIAVALLVYDWTGSAFYAAATFACSYLTWLVGGPVLSTLADRLPRRQLMIACDLLRAGLVALLVVPDVPLAAVFVVLVLVGILAPPFDAAKSAVLPEVLTGDRYVVGNALQGTVFQAARAVGFLVGGAVVQATSAQGALGIDALSFLLSAALLAARVQERPRPAPATTSLLTDTGAGVRLVAGDRVLRRMLAFGLLGGLVMVAPEGLAVPVAEKLGGGPLTAGLLVGAVPAGFLVGSLLLLRLAPAHRLALLPLLVVVSGVALLVTPALRTTGALTAAWFVCGAGSALSVVANAAYMQAVPAAVRGRAFGVAATTLMAVQGVLLLAVGALGEVLDPPVVVAVAGLVALVGVVPLARTPLGPAGTGSTAAPGGAGGAVR